jgi:large subunit ribosomal protein L4
MATLDVVTRTNEKSGTVDLDPSIFEVPVRPHLFHAEVRRQLALRRAGTHSSKNRAGVSGGGVKPYRQKGTGRARQGTIRAPQWAGGGVVFGPVPREHGHTLTKKMRRAALVSALSARQQEGAITVIEPIALDGYKTRAIADMLERLGLTGTSVLIVLGEANHRVEVSARNLPRVGVIRAEGLNVYDVLRYEKLILTREAVEALVARLNRRSGAVADGGSAR